MSFKRRVSDKEKDVLRNLIDRELLVQRAKDLNISVEGDLVKELDDIRLKNNLPDLDALEKAVTSEGINYDDFKNNIRKQFADAGSDQPGNLFKIGEFCRPRSKSSKVLRGT